MFDKTLTGHPLAVEMTLEQVPFEKHWNEFVKRSGRPGGITKVNIPRGEYLIPRGASVDCLFLLFSGSVAVRAAENERKPLPDRFEGMSGNIPMTGEKGLPRETPVLGARYYFSRRPSTRAYVALTDLVVYAIDSDTIVDIGRKSDRRDGDETMYLLMRETLINSDFADIAAERVLAQLGSSPLLSASQDDVDPGFRLLSISEEIRSLPVTAKMYNAVSSVFVKCLEARIRQAETQDIEASVVVGVG